MTKHTLHLKAPGNWINDPNGFIYYRGQYHLFYQYFPYAPVWSTMHWGHAVSDDLIYWEHRGVALFPTKYEDRNGCFSGSALETEGELKLYYTGIRYLEENPDNIHMCVNNQFEASQLMLTSKDGIHFDNFHDKKVIIPVIEDEHVGSRKDTRDPKVWKDGENFYMILGSTHKEETGRVLFFKSKDAVNWAYAAQFRNKRFGKILECPDLFRVGGQYIFMGSPMYIAEDAGGYEHHAVCMPAEFAPETCRLTLPGQYQYVDYGLDLYAPQTNIDKDGRRVMIAWMRMPRAVEEQGNLPWNGIMSIPRVVEYENGHVYFRVHPQVEEYFAKQCLLEGKALSGRPIQRPKGPCRIQATMKEGEALNIGGYKIWVERDYVKTDRTGVFAGIEGHRLVSSTPKLYGRYSLDIFVDDNLIEIFINDGQYVISNVVYELGECIEGRIERMYAEDFI